ncbi:Hypothetical predicted protein [Olea europaea subsp. europaea]|uniref:Uncharacterized protein n=1 Tax=Olea europaea subsp. europaea TaxID=158383 RepID=A0A8S0QMX7_OLEEU|nr:Hypothetical predicted protein [Olea europaea subsp. europaea]
MPVKPFFPPLLCSPQKERSWKSQCILGLTCVIIGQEMSNLEGLGAMAAEEKQLAVESKIKVQRWSDLGMCQPWRRNSFEMIVPENLPRPSARRRWETVDFSKTAPTLQVVTKKSVTKSCFSL